MVSVITSISMPLEMFNKIDLSRGNISRSKFCLKLISEGIQILEEK